MITTMACQCGDRRTGEGRGLRRWDVPHNNNNKNDNSNDNTNNVNRYNDDNNNKSNDNSWQRGRHQRQGQRPAASAST